MIDQIKPTNYVKDQLGRASMSIVLNIAVGSGKFKKSDRRSFYGIARASLFECVAVLDLLNDQNKLNKEAFDTMLNKADELSSMHYAIIKNLSAS